MQKFISRAMLLLLIAASFYSCKKDNKSNTYLEADFDGVHKSFNNKVFATKGCDDHCFLVIIGETNTEAGAVSLFSAQDDYEGKTFSWETVFLSGGTATNDFSYSPNKMNEDEITWDGTYEYGPLSSNFTCTITELRDGYVSGTFFVDIYKDDPAGMSKKEVRNGKFRAKLR